LTLGLDVSTAALTATLTSHLVACGGVPMNWATPGQYTVAEWVTFKDGGTTDPEIVNRSGSGSGSLTACQLSVFMARFSLYERAELDGSSDA
jgi:hypothetical protein